MGKINGNNVWRSVDSLVGGILSSNYSVYETISEQKQELFFYGGFGFNFNWNFAYFFVKNDKKVV
jgi:hypothetical protein